MDIGEAKRRLADAGPVDLDDLSRRIEQAAAKLNFEPCLPDATAAGFAEVPERVTVTGVFEHRPSCPRC